jgi:hypothetical protein
MQRASVFFGLACYSLTTALYGEEGYIPPAPKKAKTSYIVSLTPTTNTPSSESTSNSKVKIQKAAEAKKEKTTPTQQTEEKDSELDSVCLANPASFRLSLKHIEANGIGYDQGYTSVDGFFAFTSIENWHPFFDIRGHMFNDGLPAANVGVGVRYQPNEAHMIFGVNGFFDFRRTHHSTFEQVGFGIEALGSLWEFRGNGYFPIINSNNLYEVGFTGFTGHEAVFDVKRELSFTGFDLSIERTFFKKQFFSLSGLLGGYMFFADYGKQASGGLFKLKANLSRYFAFEGQTSYDTLFKGIVQGQVALNIPFGKKIKARKKGLSCSTSERLADRLAEDVERFEIVVVDHYNTQTLALDVRNQEILYFVFVDNLSAAGGDGTAELPYNTLAAAEANSTSEDLIYVYPGTGTTLGLDAGITLQDNQWLQASSKDLPVLTAYGASIIPAQTTLYPSIGNTSGNTITLGNNNVVNGFNILAKTSGIVGTAINGGIISNNNIVGGTSYDIFLTNVGGAISIENNSGYSATGLLVNTNQDITLLVQNNLFANRGSKNLDLTFRGSATSTASIQFNTLKFSEEGSSVSVQQLASLRLLVEGNTFTNIQDTADSALALTTANSSTAIASFQNNTFSGPSATGLSITANDTSLSSLYLLDNTSSYSGSSLTIYPFTFVTNSSATSTYYLENNTANASGFLLSNDSASANFIVQSPDLAITGVESMNSGTFTTEGDITFVSFDPSSVPN